MYKLSFGISLNIVNKCNIVYYKRSSSFVLYNYLKTHSFTAYYLTSSVPKGINGTFSLGLPFGKWRYLLRTNQIPAHSRLLNDDFCNRTSKQFSNCRRSISIDPILWLPMSKSERSRCIRWRLGWLPDGKPRPCPKHPMQQLSKNHAINCLDMHRRLFMPETVQDPLSFLLNMLPLRPSIPQSSALIW
ncbi:hypothetical protein G6F47_006039 [Rhizopus delemar]|nr:hypothetical protein G6F49_010829 [Rhizopus delemar]KAG1598870.1 hypothetical protein G6F47_006039 [Rhizopus delemar]KAG1644894.1 hypothetical protein G6F44_002370 [Rhizopus delemar]